MPDEMDRAQEINEQHTHDALAECFRRGIRNSMRQPGDQGTECVDCGEEIPAGRLKLMPHAARCVSCQTLHENWRPM